MFFKRAAKNSAPKPALGSVQTIPEIFYGGSDPEASLHGVAASKIVKPNTVASGSDAGGVGGSHSKTKLIAASMIAIFVLVSGVAVWAYWKYLGGGTVPTVTSNLKDPGETDNKIIEPVQTENASTQIPTSTELIASSTENNNVTSTVTSTLTTLNTTLNLTELAIDFPALNQLNATDFDSDALTDAEEEIFGTDQSVFDTDADGYSDGQEVLNLYNPKGNNPVRLAESGLVREFTHPKDLYRLYYPITWQAGSVDAASNTMLFTAANGDYVEARVFAKNNNEDFDTWFGRVAKDQQIVDLQLSSNNFKTAYHKRKDGLVAYVDLPGQVLVILYHPLVNAPISYRTAYQVMLESLRVVGVTNSVAL